MEKGVCLRAVAEATDDFREAQALVARPSSHPLLDNTSPYLHIETLGAMSKKILMILFGIFSLVYPNIKLTLSN